VSADASKPMPRSDLDKLLARYRKRIEAARVYDVAMVTPLLPAERLSQRLGNRVLLKREDLQPVFSFKLRGAYNKIVSLTEAERARGVITASAGNHAQGVALAAKRLGLTAWIVMPKTTPALKVDAVRRFGGKAILHGDTYDEARDHALALASERGMTMVHPYDDPAVIAGQGTVGLEIAEDAGVDEADVLVCCGGGGLTSGIALALEARAPGLRVRPVEPQGFDDVARSLAAGAIQRNDRLSGSICDAIITPQPGDITFPIMSRLCGPGMAVTEDEALRAMALAFQRLKVVLEPGGAVALAAALFHGDAIEGDAVIAVASGGNVDAAMFARALETLG